MKQEIEADAKKIIIGLEPILAGAAVAAGDYALQALGAWHPTGDLAVLMPFAVSALTGLWQRQGRPWLARIAARLAAK